MHISYVEQSQPHRVHSTCREYSMQIQSHTFCPLASVFLTILYAESYNCVLTVFLNKGAKDLICLWESCSPEQNSGHPGAWLQVQGVGAEWLHHSHSTDRGHTAGAGLWWIVWRPPSDLAVMETVADCTLLFLSRPKLHLQNNTCLSWLVLHTIAF